MRTVIDRLEVSPPAFDIAEACVLLETAFGLSGELVSLHGERDLNFRVVDPQGRRFLLKFHNPADGVGVVHMQTEALLHVARVDPDLPVCRVVPSRDGAPWRSAKASDGRESLVRLFTFLDGHHAGREELDEGALREWGTTVARLGRALRGFFHASAGYEIQWDIRRTLGLRARLSHLDEEPREVVTEVLERFEQRVLPVVDRLRAQVIHNDMSRENLLVDGRGAVVGITDFGDMTHAALICDLAIAIADVLDGREDALEMAEPMIAGYHAVTPLEPEETAILAELVAARCATSVVVTAWRPPEDPLAPSVAEGAWQFLQLLREEGFDRVASRFAHEVERPHAGHGVPYRPRPTAELLRARRSVLGPLALTHDTPVHLVRGEGVFLFGSDGQRYLDAYNNVPVVGHCHPEVVRAIATQMRLLNTNTRYLQEATVALAEQLVESAAGRFDRVLFVNSGSEANDVAWRIARFATGHRGAIVTRFAYHGLTEAATDLSPEEWPRGYAPVHVRLVTPPSSGRVGSPADMEPFRLGEEMDVAAAVDELTSSRAGVAALFVDPAFTSDGILGPANAWVQQAAAAVRAAGGLVIADEVQAGFGRTGADLWSITSAGISPDVMTLGKPMGNGYPVAAILTRSDLVDGFMTETGYFSTFGGNTVACVAGLAVLRVIEDEGLITNANEVGTYLLRRLEEVADRHLSVGQVRGWGLLAGIEIVREGEHHLADAGRAGQVVNRLKDLGVLIGTTGPAANVLKIRPPLVFERSHVDVLAERLDEALAR